MDIAAAPVTGLRKNLDITTKLVTIASSSANGAGVPAVAGRVFWSPWRPTRGRVVPVDENTLEELSEDECIELLGAHSVGRIAVVRDSQPLIFPVNYVLDGRTVAFRTDPGTKLTGATLGRVAFQIDSNDPLSWEGWSVLVKGIGTDITDARDARSKRIVSSLLVPWAGGAKDHWVAIASPVFTGRRIVHRRR